MAIDRRLVDVYWDVVNRVIRDVSGEEIRERLYPYITFREEVIINLHLVTDNSDPGTKYTGAAGLIGGSTTFQATIDDDFDHSSVVMCKATDSAINVATEWNTSGGNADPLVGEFSIRINGDTSTFQTAVGSGREAKNVLLELQIKDGAGAICWSDRIPFRGLNIQDDNGTTPPSVGITRGTASIASGVSVHTVTGLGLSGAPTKVFCQVGKPTNSGAGSYNIFATPIEDTYTSAGFTAHLSGTTDTATYKLHYEVEV